MTNQSPEKKPAAKRVTATETRFNRFFKWPYYSTNFQGSFDEQWIRFPIVYRWKNLPPKYGGLKLIDFTGMLQGGTAFACEVKQQDINADPDGTKGRFRYDRVSDRQRKYLSHMAEKGGIAWLGLGFVDGRKPIATFLLPWRYWLIVEDEHRKRFKSGKEELWRSISHDWVMFYCHMYALHAYKPKGKDWAYFTKLEHQIWLANPDGSMIPRAIPFLHASAMTR